MKRLALLLLLSGPALAQPTGFSPTMPFGIPASAHITVSPVNTGGPALPAQYYRSSYYYGYGGGGVYGYASGSPTSTYGGNLPGYGKALPQKDLPSYTNSSRRKSDQLPGYNQP